jgi:putative transposase
VARLPLFKKPADYEAFERVLAESHQRVPLEIFAYCVMPNHWHFVLRPIEERQLTPFLRWLTQTHTMRWHAHRHTSGSRHLYQGWFEAFPVARDDHFYTVAGYVERDALRAGLVTAAEEWRWSSLWRRAFGTAESRRLLG